MSHLPSSDPRLAALLAPIFQHERRYWGCVASVEQRAGWVAFHNERFLTRIDPNHAGLFRAPMDQSGTLVEGIISFYQEMGAVPSAYIDLLTTPEDLIPHLRQANFREWDGALSDLMLYLGPDRTPPTTAEVEVADTEAAKAAWASIVEDEAAHDAHARAALYAYYRTQISDPLVTAYFSRVDGEPASRCHLFSYGGLGRIDAVLTHPAHRGRGLATAVVRRALSDSLRRNRTTYLYVEPQSDAQRLYRRLGFAIVAQRAIRGFLWQG